jgi:protein gp37
MRKSKIDWCDMSWNPVTGCLHGCKYCYARRIAERFGMPQYDKDCHVYTGKVKSYDDAVHTGLFPWGFAPTLHKYRLDEPQRAKKPQNIFVCSMADLFGNWVPDEWVQEVFAACEKAPQHRYLFLTKNPERYEKLNDSIAKLIASTKALTDIAWFGVTACNQDMVNKAFETYGEISAVFKLFLSIEPIFAKIEFPEEIKQLWVDWVIIGAETGNRKDKVIPKREWVESIVEQCRAADVPVFMKANLADVWGENLIQQYPW